MKAAVFYGPNDMRIEARPMPASAPDEMLLKVAACAICGSDVRTYRYGAGNITEPITMGHEIAGTVVETGSALQGFRRDQRVAVAPAVPCGQCRYCLRGIQTMCDNLRSIGYQFHGGFAEYMVVPSSAIRAGCVNSVPENLSLEQATLAEPLACAINAQELLDVGMGDSVVILGAGALGCMHADLARLRGALKILLVDIQPHRLEMARSFSADVLIDGSTENVSARVLAETDAIGATVVIVAAPSGEAQELALTLAAKQGRISFFGGLPKSKPCISFNANVVHYRELFIMGAYGSKPRHNRAALDLLAGGRLHVSSLIGMVVPLERIQDGLDAAAQGKFLKVVVQPNT